MSSAEVESCTLISRDTVIAQGTELPLVAVAVLSDGVSTTELATLWVSDAPERIQVRGPVAVGGRETGVANITATVAGHPCAGQLRISNHAAAVDVIQVVVVDGLRRPVPSAVVSAETSSAVLTSTAGQDGVALLQSAGELVSITVSAPGYATVTVLQPTGDALLFPISKTTSESADTVLRGSVDFKELPRADFSMAIVGRPLRPSLLDLDLGSQFCRTAPVPAPDDPPRQVAFPEGMVVAWGSEVLTATPERCKRPVDSSVGCFISRGPPGASMLWTMAATLKLSQISAVLSGQQEPGFRFSCTESTVERVALTLPHAFRSFQLTTTPVVIAESAPNWVSVTARPAARLKSLLRVPDLGSTSAEDPLDAVVAVVGSRLMTQGWSPIGITGGVDGRNGAGLDGLIDPSEATMGYFAELSSPGEMPLHISPPTVRGAASDLVVALLALDKDATLDRAGDRLSGIVQSIEDLSKAIEVSGRFMAPPHGRFDRERRTFVPSSERFAGTIQRLEFRRGSAVWHVFAPAGLPVELPSQGQGLIPVSAPTTLKVTILDVDDAYGSSWRLGAEASVRPGWQRLRRFATRVCGQDDACLME